MRLECVSLLPCTPERLRAELAKPKLLNELAQPMLVFVPVSPPWFPERWEPGDYRTRLLLASTLPIGEHTLKLRDDFTDPVVWHDVGGSNLIRLWEHTIVLEDVAGMTRYTDQVRIRAGLLTLPAALFAKLFYAHRQRRLSRLVNRDFRRVPD